MDITREKHRRSSELHRALLAKSTGHKPDKVSAEAEAVAEVLLNTNDLLATALVTPVTNFFIRNVVRALDSLFVAYTEQPNKAKRARSMKEILERIDRGLYELGLPALKSKSKALVSEE